MLRCKKPRNAQSSYRVALLGNGGVGKTCLTLQFCQNIFVQEYDPTIENLYRKQVLFDNVACMLEILDTAGQEEFSVMREQYIRSGDCFMLVYSIESRASFEALTEIRESVLRVKEDEKAALIMVVAAKSDLDHLRAVSEAEGLELANSFRCPFVEVSAKTRSNVEEAFYLLFKMMKEADQSRDAGLGKRKKKAASKCNLL